MPIPRMPQFTVYLNRDSRSKGEIPFLLDVQSDLLSELRTRVVIPLYLKSSLSGKLMTKLSPEVQVEGKKLVLMTPQLAGISVKDLGEPVGSLAEHRGEIIAALDLLFTGF